MAGPTLPDVCVLGVSRNDLQMGCSVQEHRASLPLQSSRSRSADSSSHPLDLELWSKYLELRAEFSPECCSTVICSGAMMCLLNSLRYRT